MAPIAKFGHFPANHVEIKFTETSCDVSQRACSNGTMIDGCDRTDLRARTAIEGFIGEIEFGPVDFPLLDFHFQFIPDELNDGTPRNPFQNIGGDRRRRQNAITKHEEIRRRSFRNVPVGVQHDGFIEASPHCICLYESRVHIRAGDFATCRDRVVIDPSP